MALRKWIRTLNFTFPETTRFLIKGKQLKNAEAEDQLEPKRVPPIFTRPRVTPATSRALFSSNLDNVDLLKNLLTFLSVEID